jgi:hypothetical protein
MADQPAESGDKPKDGTRGGAAIGDLSAILSERFRAGRATRTVVYHFCIDDEEWTLTVGPDSFDLQNRKPSGDPDCYLKTTHQILLGTVRGEYKPSLSDLMTGRIRATNPQLLLMLRDVFGGS